MSSSLFVSKSYINRHLRPTLKIKNSQPLILAQESTPRLGPAHPFLILLCALATLWFSAMPVCAQTRPNVLLLVADDQRPDTVAALGNPHIQTPNLDGLVRHGTTFTRATCAHPLRYPDRPALLTGC